MRRRQVIGLLGGGVALSALSASATPQPARMIDPDALGPLLFDERFVTFDVGQDQEETAKPHRWRTVYGHGGPASPDNRNGVSAIYVDPEFGGISDGKALAEPLNLNPFEHRPGELALVASKTPPALRGKLLDKPYISGIITTRFSFVADNAYFEADIKFPKGKGMFPAFWLMPRGGTWPEGGEIDIIEHLGKDPKTLYTSIHAKNVNLTRPHKVDFDATADFHRYGVVYTPHEMIWYIDRREVFRQPTPPDVTEPMFILLNLAVGGDWAEEPDAATAFPAKMLIREVKVWRMPPPAPAKPR